MALTATGSSPGFLARSSRHPYRFASALGLLAGLGWLLQLQEGLPPNWRIGLLVAGFISVSSLRPSWVYDLAASSGCGLLFFCHHPERNLIESSL
jgi:hypothetical protein